MEPDQNKRGKARKKLAEHEKLLLQRDKITKEKIYQNHAERTKAHEMSQCSNDEYYEYMKEV